MEVVSQTGGGRVTGITPAAKAEQDCRWARRPLVVWDSACDKRLTKRTRKRCDWLIGRTNAGFAKLPCQTATSHVVIPESKSEAQATSPQMPPRFGKCFCISCKHVIAREWMPV